MTRDVCEAGLSITTLVNSKQHMKTVGKRNEGGDSTRLHDLRSCVVPNKCILPDIKTFQLFKKEVSCPDVNR